MSFIVLCCSRAAKRFFQPLRVPKYLYLVLALAAVFAAILHMKVTASIAHDFAPGSLLGIELMKESGPCFEREKEPHISMLVTFARRSDERVLSRLCEILYPEYSLKRQIRLASRRLRASSPDRESAEEAIHRTGEQIARVCIRGKRFTGDEVKWLQHEEMPEWLTKLRDDAFEESHQLVTQLTDELNMESAIAICKANREALLLFGLGCLRHSNIEYVEQFLADVERAYEYTTKLAHQMNDGEPDQVLALKWAESEYRRIDILKAAVQKDMNKVHKLLAETIQIAFEELEQTESLREMID